jgi:tRNA C32,U32 (ribose-2'-O)-methylase TrmJ
MGYLYSHIDRYLDTIHHPKFKRENTMILIRRILGRANLTTREASTLHGLLRRSEWHIDPSSLDRDKTGGRNLEEGRDAEPDPQDQ